MICRKNKIIEMLKPLSIVMLLLSIFSIVWLRSSFVSLEYSISSLEKKKTVLMKNRKILAAERASLLSVERFEKVAGSSAVNSRFTFPDRVRVVYVKKAKDNEPYKASFKDR